MAQTVGRGIALLFQDLGSRSEWVVSSTPRPTLPQERPATHRTGGWVCTGPVWTDGNYRPPPGFDPRTVQPVASRYNGWAIRPMKCSRKQRNDLKFHTQQDTQYVQRTEKYRIFDRFGIGVIERAMTNIYQKKQNAYEIVCRLTRWLWNWTFKYQHIIYVNVNILRTKKVTLWNTRHSVEE